MVFELQESDYEPLSRFKHLWRWTSPTHAMFPTNVLERIRPIADARAALIDEYAMARFVQYGGLKPESFRDLRLIGTESEDESAVSHWLFALPVSDEETVIVSWDAHTAVTAPFGLVATYWSDFFYPASDDAAVIPLPVDWMLVWHHEERFEFGIPIQS